MQSSSDPRIIEPVELRVEGLPYDHLRRIAALPGRAEDMMLCTGSALLEDFRGRLLVAQYHRPFNAEDAMIAEVQEGYFLREVEHVSTPEAMLVDCMVRNDVTAKDAIKLLLKDDNNTYSKNELYAASLELKNRFG